MCVRNLWNWPVFFFFFFLVAGVFLLCNWPDYTSNETGPHALFEYLNTVAPPQGSTLGPLYKLLLDLSLPPPSEGPSCFNFFIRDWPCLQPPRLPSPSFSPAPLCHQPDLNDQGACWTRDPWVPPLHQVPGWQKCWQLRMRQGFSLSNEHSHDSMLHFTVSSHPRPGSVQRSWQTRSAVWGGVLRM